jgi:hypothetical protein
LPFNEEESMLKDVGEDSKENATDLQSLISDSQLTLPNT